MEVYFFRHGEAGPAAPGGSDESRELTEGGKRDSHLVAAALRAAGAKPEAIFTSPLLRARQTGEILQGTFGVTAQADERLRAGTTLGAVQALVAECAKARVVLVGHEPDFSTIVGQLTGGRVKLRTSGVARLEAETFEPGHGTLMWLVSPELFGFR